MSQLLGQNNVLGEKGFEDADRCQRHVTVPDREVGRQAHRPWRMCAALVACCPWDARTGGAQVVAPGTARGTASGGTGTQREGFQSKLRMTGAHQPGGKVPERVRRIQRRERWTTGAQIAQQGAPQAVETARPTKPPGQPNRTLFRPPLLLARCCCQLRRPSRALHGSQAVR